VVWSVAGDSWDQFRMHMTDFNPSAVARGVGKVVREPTLIPSGNGFTQDVMTYLPYMEVVNDYRYPFVLHGILVDEERILILTQADTSVGVSLPGELMKLMNSLSIGVDLGCQDNWHVVHVYVCMYEQGEHSCLRTSVLISESSSPFYTRSHFADDLLIRIPYGF
jgi:hypothetical protein